MRKRLCAKILSLALVGGATYASASNSADPFEAVKQAAREKADEKQADIAERLKTSHWQIHQARSPMDDSLAVRLDTVSTKLHRDRYGREKPIIVTLVCRENSTNVYISFAEHFMSDNGGRGRVEYRVDDRPAKSRNFSESNDHSVLGLWGGGSSIPWIKSLYGGKKLYLRATPFSESAVEGEVNIEGIEEVIKPLAKACNWKP